MTSYATPARVRFPRSNDSGVVPETVAPGSFAINWEDQKIYVGGPDGIPRRIAQWMTDWSSALSYRTGDFVIRDGDIYRARRDLAANTPFTLSDWEALTSSARGAIAEPYATSILSGGEVAQIGSNLVSVSAGSGVWVDASDPTDISSVVAEWGDFTASMTGTAGWKAFGINRAGNTSSIDFNNLDAQWRENHILLAYVLWDAVASEIISIYDASIPAANTSVAFRDTYFSAGGPFRVKGGRLQSNSDLTLNLSAMTIFELGAEWRTDPEDPNLIDLAAQTPTPIQYATRTQLVGAPGVNVDPDQWDDGGVLTPVPADDVTIQFLSVFTDGQVYAQYGQATYPSTSAAIDNIVAEWDNLAAFTASGPSIPLAALVVMQGATDLSSQAFIVPAVGRVDSFGASAEAAGDTSQFYLLDGSRTMTGPMNMGGFAINNGIIDGGVFP